MGEPIRAEHPPPREKIHPRGRIKQNLHLPLKSQGEEEEDPPRGWERSALAKEDRPARGERIPSREERIRPRGRGSTHVGEDRSASGGTTLEGGTCLQSERSARKGEVLPGRALRSTQGNAQFKLLKNVRSHVGVMIHSLA